jgi:WD40 repeat protein
MPIALAVGGLAALGMCACGGVGIAGLLLAGIAVHEEKQMVMAIQAEEHDQEVKKRAKENADRAEAERQRAELERLEQMRLERVLDERRRIEEENARVEKMRLEKELDVKRRAEEEAKPHHGEYKRLKMPDSSEVRSLRFTADGKSLIAATIAEGVFSWDLSSWNCKRHELDLVGFGVPGRSVGAAAISPSGDKAFFGRHGGSLRFYDLTRNPSPQTSVQIGVPERMFAFNHIAVSSDGQRIVTCHGDCIANLWNVASRERISALADFKDQVHSATFLADTNTFAAGSQSIRVWSPEPSQKIELKVAAGSSCFESLQYSPDGRFLTGVKANTLYHWDSPERIPEPIKQTFPGKAMHVAYSPDGQILAVAIYPARVLFYDPASLKQRFLIDMPKDLPFGNRPEAIAFHPQSQLFAVVRAGQIYLFDLRQLEKQP